MGGGKSYVNKSIFFHFERKSPNLISTQLQAGEVLDERLQENCAVGIG
jgi:hypothetical protein